MKIRILLLFLLVSTTITAQMEFRGQVVDAQTGEVLPYVNIYVSPQCKTLTNAEGNFVIQAMPDDVLKFSCIGYSRRYITASKLAGIIRLTPQVTDLQELTVSPIEEDDFLKLVVKKLKRDAKRKASSRFFSRILFADDNGRELMEAFMTAKPAVSLHEFSMITGRKEDTAYNLGMKTTRSSNVHKLFEVGPTTYASAFWKHFVKPLDDLRHLSELYDIESSRLTGDDGELIYKIELRPKHMKKQLAAEVPYGERGMLWGTLYAEAETHRLLRFDGEAGNFVIRSQQYFYPVTMKLHIDYQHVHGFTEVSHLSLHGKSDRMYFNALLFNVDDMYVSANASIDMQSDMIGAIRQAGYDADMWDSSDIVMRTQEEEAVAREMSPDRATEEVEDYQPSIIVQQVKGLLMQNGNLMPLRHVRKPEKK